MRKLALPACLDEGHFCDLRGGCFYIKGPGPAGVAKRTPGLVAAVKQGRQDAERVRAM